MRREISFPRAPRLWFAVISSAWLFTIRRCLQFDVWVEILCSDVHKTTWKCATHPDLSGDRLNLRWAIRIIPNFDVTNRKICASSANLIKRVTQQPPTLLAAQSIGFPIFSLRNQPFAMALCKIHCGFNGTSLCVSTGRLFLVKFQFFPQTLRF